MPTLTLWHTTFAPRPQPQIRHRGKQSGSVARRTGGLIVVVVVVVLTDEKGVEARFMPISHTLSHPLTPSHTA